MLKTGAFAHAKPPARPVWMRRLGSHLASPRLAELALRLGGLGGPLAEVSHAQGLLMVRLADVGLALRDQASLAALTNDVVKISEIEGEHLNVESVRSSIARRLGVDVGALARARSQSFAAERLAHRRHLPA